MLLVVVVVMRPRCFYMAFFSRSLFAHFVSYFYGTVRRFMSLAQRPVQPGLADTSDTADLTDAEVWRGLFFL